MNQATQFRRDLHQIPETSFTEFKTKEYVVSVLKTLHCEVIELLETGAAAYFDAGQPATLAYRADMDALPIQEEKTNGGGSQKACVSEIPGVQHACGHDGHTSVALEVCRWLVDHKDQLKGTIKVLFQPAEEGVRGAGAMAASGVVDDVDTLIGAHVGTFAKLGTIGLCESGFLASTKIDVHFHGRPSHAGADPEKGRSALMAACAAAMMMQGIPRSGEGTTRIAVGRLNAGEGRNVTPVHADMQLEVRGETGEINQYMVKNVENIVEGVKRAYEVEAEIVKAGEATTLPSCPEVLDLIESVAKTVPGVESIERFNKPSGSEDCTLLIERVVQHGGRGAYFLFGCNHHGHHRADFEIQDETSLPMAFNMFKGLALRLNGI